MELGTADVSPGAPQDEMLQLFGLDEEGRIALQVWFDVEDIDAAIAELDAAHARLEEHIPSAARERRESSRRSVQRATLPKGDWDEIAAMLADDVSVEDRRRVIPPEINDRAGMLDMRYVSDRRPRASRT